MNKFFNFLEIEKRIWGNNLITVPLFDALLILFAMVCGAFTGSSRALGEIFNFTVSAPHEAIVYGVIMAYLYMLAETFFGAKDWKVMVLRPLLLAAEIALAYVLGMVLSLIIIAVVAIVLFLIVLGLILNMVSGGLNTKTVRGRMRSDGGLDGDDGKVYDIGSDGKARERNDLLG